ncbi:MAG TPA: sensor histidine kinase [Ardenticatenaceae bacterium]|nr:sensor histidine kinase [Ardenticatenaceae bacterium]
MGREPAPAIMVEESTVPTARVSGGQPGVTPKSLGAWMGARLFPRGDNILMLAAYAILLMALITLILQRNGELPAWRFYGAILALAALLALNLTSSEEESLPRIMRNSQLLLLVSGALFLLAFWLSLHLELIYVLFMLNAQAVVQIRLRDALGYSIGLALAWLGIFWAQGVALPDLVGLAMSAGLGLIFTTTFGLVIVGFSRQRARVEALLQQLQTANAELLAAREREKELTAAEERVRLAREIHDGLGHHLTVLNVQLQAAAKLVGRDPARAADAIAVSRAEAQAALDEVRQSVAAMRATPLDGRSLQEALQTLVHDFDRHSPLTARFDLLGVPTALPPAASMTLYRAAQEGLTNAQKHAAVQEVTVTLAFSSAGVRLTVEDDGAEQNAPARGGGFGLAGLRERAEQLGGTLRAGPRSDGGFVLSLALPLEQDAR